MGFMQGGTHHCLAHCHVALDFSMNPDFIQADFARPKARLGADIKLLRRARQDQHEKAMLRVRSSDLADG
jgi:hypothetical protein